MDRELKIVFGKLLGEVYRLQRHAEDFKNGPDEGRIYGLLNGIESAIDEELEEIGFVTNAQIEAVETVLDDIDQHPGKTESFSGFYDIENELASRGVSRSDAIRVLKYLKAENRFTDLIQKMDSSNSPSECRKFDIDYDV